MGPQGASVSFFKAENLSLEELGNIQEQQAKEVRTTGGKEKWNSPAGQFLSKRVQEEMQNRIPILGGIAAFLNPPGYLFQGGVGILSCVSVLEVSCLRRLGCFIALPQAIAVAIWIRMQRFF